MQTESPQLIFAADDLANFCATDTATIYSWVKKGEIAFFKTPGGRFRFHREAVIDFLRRFHFPLPRELVDGRARLIAIDPDPSWLARVKSTLGRGFDVVTFGDAYDALFAIGGQKPDAVVMEARLPGIDGSHCIRRIRARDGLRHARVVVFAAHEGERKACLEAGAAAFVLKPATDELHSTVRRALGQR